MKKSLTIILSIASSIAFCQKFSISADKMNILYAGIPNPLTAVFENLSCDSFFLTTNNGEITGKDCRYEFWTIQVGEATIFIQKKVNVDTITIGKEKFRIKRIPKPIVQIDGISGGEIGKLDLSIQWGILAWHSEVCDKVVVTHFSIMIIHEGNPVLTSDSDSGEFTKSLKQQFYELISGDKVLFYNIKARSGNGIIDDCDPISFTIK